MKWTRLVGVSLIMAVAIFAMMLPHSAHAMTRSQQATKAKCNHTMVYLHGSQPATVTCMDKLISAHGVSPNINQWNCSDSNAADLEDPYGHDICFKGYGGANLTNYNDFGPVSWNDMPEWITTGCADGYYTSDINGGGNAIYFNSYQRDTVPYGFGMSYLFLYANC